MLHQMLKVRWAAWRALDPASRAWILEEASATLTALEEHRSAAFSLLGHKGDLMLVHFRENFDQLGQVEATLVHTRLWDYLEQSSSYLSVVELGLYESTLKVYTSLIERGIAPHSDAWNAEVGDTLERQRQAMQPRLYPEIPPPHFCAFTPWIGAAERKRIGTRFPWRSASARWPNTARSAAAMPGQ